jgi:hypothetical protein
MMHSTPALLLASVALAAAAATSLAQPSAPSETEQVRASELGRAEIARRIEQSLPKWGDEVLRAPQDVTWTAKLQPARVAELLGDRELMAVIRRAPRGAQLFQSKGSTLRIDPERGELRYVSRYRTVDPMSQVGPLPSVDRANQSVIRTLTALGLPSGEFAQAHVVSQISSGGSVRAKAPETKAEVYRLVTVPRVVGGVPVFVSDARVALTPKGEVQRLRVTWPALGVPRNMRIASREAVVERAADLLADHGVTAQAEIRTSLVYTPADPKSLRAYLPAVMFTVLESPTPFIFSVPVVEPPEGDDDDRTAG